MKRLGKFISVFLVIGLSGCGSSPTSPAEKYAGVSAKNLIKQGEIAMGNGYYSKSVEQFEALKTLYPFSQYARQAQLDLIYAHYEASEDALAVAAADRYIRLYPRGKDVDYAYYMKALVSFRRVPTTMQRVFQVDAGELDKDSLKEAFEAFRKLVRLYPDSKYAFDSKARMVYIRNLMAKHELQVAQFYLDNNMPLSAANRAGYVIKYYAGSPLVSEAREILKKAKEHEKK